MITVHPEYDPLTLTWFVPDLEHEATTLRELQDLLGPQAVIADYYPGGLGHAVHVRRCRDEEKRRSLAASPHNAPPIRARSARPLSTRIADGDRRRSNGGRHRPKHDHDLILDLWQQGMLPRDIAARCGGGLTEAVARSTVMVARQKGDLRAVRRDKSAEQRAEAARKASMARWGDREA